MFEFLQDLKNIIIIISNLPHSLTPSLASLFIKAALTRPPSLQALMHADSFPP